MIDLRPGQSLDVALVGTATTTQNSEIELPCTCQFVSSPNLDIGRSQMVQFVEISGARGEAFAFNQRTRLTRPDWAVRKACSAVWAYVG